METIEVSVDGFASALKQAMAEARTNERLVMAREIQDMVHENMPGPYINLLREVVKNILEKTND